MIVFASIGFFPLPSLFKMSLSQLMNSLGFVLPVFFTACGVVQSKQLCGCWLGLTLNSPFWFTNMDSKRVKIMTGLIRAC